MLFFYFIDYKDHMMLVLFLAALHAVVRMSLVVSAAFVKTYEHYFKFVVAFALFHVV